MLREIIPSAKNTVILDIPDELVGKRIEIIVFASDEVKPGVAPPSKMALFRGVLSENVAQELQDYVSQSRNEWDRNI